MKEDGRAGTRPYRSMHLGLTCWWPLSNNGADDHEQGVARRPWGDVAPEIGPRVHRRDASMARRHLAADDADDRHAMAYLDASSCGEIF